MEPIERKNETILRKEATLDQKLCVLRILHETSQAKTNHFDVIRQQNLRYSILIFSGLIAVAFSFDHFVLRCFIVTGLSVLMCIFLLQDTRIHRRTHAFRGTTYRSLQAMAYLVNGGEDDITVWRYDREAAKEAERINLRLALYWFLLVASVLSSIPLCILRVSLSTP